MLPKLVVGFTEGSSGKEISDEYKAFMEEVFTGVDEYPTTPEEWEEYWAKEETTPGSFVKTDKTTDENVKAAAENLGLHVGESATIAGFFDGTTIDKGTAEKYDTTDTPTYMSANSNVATVDGKGTVTGVTEGSTTIYIVVNGKIVAGFSVNVSKTVSDNVTIEATKAYVTNGGSVEIAEGKYVANVSAGSVPSLNSLKDAVGEENIKSVTFKNADGSAVTDLSNEEVKGWNIIYFVNSTTGTVYYAITDAKGMGEIRTKYGNVAVLDIEQAKANFVIPEGALTINVNGVKTTATADKKTVTADDTVYVTEGTTFTLADIAKVQGATNPTITVENSDKGTDTQNVSYDALTKTFTVNELTDKNSDTNNEETITFSYKVSESDTRTVSVKFVTVKPALKVTKAYGITGNDIDINGGTYYVAKDKIAANDPNNVTPVYVKAVDKDGNVDIANVITAEYKVTSSDEKKVTVDTDGKTLAFAKDYAKAGDTVTLTYTFEQGQTVSYTIEVVDKLPRPVENGLGTNKFEYSKDNTQGQMISFNNIVKTDVALPAGCELVVNVADGTSSNVTYMKGEETQNNNGTVDATEIKLTATGNNRYTLEGIEVGSKENVAADTKIAFTVSVVDADGNVISKSANITVYIVGGDEAVPEINLNSAKLTAKDGTDNKVATYQYTPVEGWELQNTAATNIGVEGAVTGNDTITLTLTDPYISETEKTTTATLTFKKGDVIKTKDVTLKYTGVVEDTKDLNIALTNNTAAFDSAEATSVTYTLDTAKMNGWTLKEQTVTLADGTVTANGDTITLTFKGAPIEDGSTSPVSLTLTKAGQNEINKEVTLNYTAYQVAP